MIIGWRGAVLIAVVISSEIAPKNCKVLFMFVPVMGYHIGEMLIAIESYLIRDWKLLQLVEFSPILAMIALCFFMPEPARWLLSKGKYSQAKKLLKKQAKVSGIEPIPEELFAPTTIVPEEVEHPETKTSLSFLESIKAQ